VTATGARKPRGKRRRRMAVGALLVVIGGGTLAYRHLTDPERVRAIVETQLQRYAPGLVSVGSAEFSMFHGTVIHDVVVRARDGADLPPVLECPRIEVVHGPFGAIVGHPDIEALLAIEPRCTIVQDRASNKTSLAGVIEEVASSQPGETHTLPLIELRDAGVRVIARRNGQDRVVEDLHLTVRGRTSPKDSSLYDIVWQSRDVGGAAPIGGYSQLDLSKGALRNVEGGLPRMSVEAVMLAVNASVDGAGAWAELLGLGGTLHARDYNLAGGGVSSARRSATIDLADATIAIPCDDEDGRLPHDRRYLRFKEVNGTLIVSATQIVAAFAGSFHGRPCSVEGTIQFGHEPQSLSDLGFDVRLAIDALDLPRPDRPDRPEEARVIAAWPGIAHLYELFDATGPADIEIEVFREPGCDSPTRIRRVVLRPDGMSVVALAFPYRLEQLSGAIEITEAGGTVRSLHCRHGDADISITGEFDAPGSCAKAEVRVHGTNVRLDEELRDALLPFQRNTWDAFAPQGSVNIDVSAARQGCNEPRAGEWLVTTAVSFDDLAARFEQFPYPLQHVRGSLVLSEDKVVVPAVSMTQGDTEMRASGEIGTTANGLGRVQLSIGGTNVSFDDTLLNSLPADIRETAAPFHPTGRLDFDTTLAKEPSEGKLGHSTRVTLRGNTIKHEHLPLLITDVLGELHVTDTSTELVDITGRHGTATLRATGTVDRGEHGDSLNLTFECSRVSPDAKLIQTLPDSLRQHIAPWTVDGEIDLVIRARSTPSAPHDRHVSTEITLDGAAVTPPRFSAPVTDLRGRLSIDQRGIRSPGGLTGRFGPAKLGGDFDVFFQDGVPKEAAARLSVRDVVLDDSVRALLSKQFQDLWVQLRPDGVVDVTIDKLTYRSQPGSGSSTLTIEGGRAKMRDVALANMVGIDRAVGDVSFDGALRDRRGGIVLSGDLDLAGLRIFERKLSQVTSGWTLLRADDGHGQLRLSKIEGRMYDGTANGSLDVMMDPQESRYELTTSLRDVDIEPLLKPDRRATDEDAQLQGRTDVEVELSGTIGDAESKRGRGTLAIDEGRIYQLPIVFALLQVLNLSVPDRDTFDLVRASGLIDGNEITITEARIAGEAMALLGKGSVSIPSLTADLNFVSVNPKRGRHVPVLTNLLEGMAGELVVLGVSGTLHDPIVQVRLLRGITDELDRIFVPQKPKKR